MRSLARNGGLRLAAAAAVPAAAAFSLALAGCGQVQAAALRGARTATSPPAVAGHDSWRLLVKQRPADGGNLSVLVALPNGAAWVFGGYGQRAPYTGRPLAEYWNGKALSAVALPAEQNCGPIAAAGASSPSSVWAVGVDGCVLRFTGRTWQVAKDWTGIGQLTGITVLGPNDVWVFGATGLPAGRPGLGTWHYDGRTWQPVHGIGGEIQTASASSANDIWAVGVTVQGQQTSSFLAHYNGQSWQRVTGVRQPGGVLAAGRQVWATSGLGPEGVLMRMTGPGHWVTVPVPHQRYVDLATADGEGGIWLTAYRTLGSGPSVRNIALHLSSAGKWTETALTTGAVQLALSRVPGPAAVLALGRVKADAALFGYGKF